MNLSSPTSRSPWALFAVLLLAGILAFSGSLVSSDEILMAMTTRAIVTDFSLRFPETYGQTFTGYGLGMPLLGVPAFMIESALRRFGVLSSGTVTLLPLTNVVCFAVLGLLAAGIARRLVPDKQEYLSPAVAIALLASPLLPASQTFYSEVPAALGLVGLAWALLQPAEVGAWRRWGAPVLLPALAMFSRVSMLPALLLVVAWGWLACPCRKRLWLAGLGIGLGIAARLLQNAALRGSPFAQGYDGQEFTTPLVTGLHGLLFSPERGLMVFYPVLFWAVLPGRSSGIGVRDFERLVIAVVGYSVLFHASFWTWHGGWTAGPRFLLPAIALATPLVAILLLRIGELRVRLRLFLGLLVGWGAVAAVLASAFNPIGVWNELWGFHRVESRWLYEPSLSLWRYWSFLAASGDFHPVWLRWLGALLPAGYPSRVPLVILATGVWLVGTFGLLWAGWRWVAVRRWAVATAGVVLGLGVAGLLSGPRGWQTLESPGGPDGLPVMRLDGGAEGGEFLALVNLRPHGEYTFSVKSNGLYEVVLDDKVLFSQPAVEPQHLATAGFRVEESGLRELRVRVRPAPGVPLLFRLYWTWPGEGRVLEPVGGGYTQPRTLSALEEAASRVWGRASLLLGAWLALVLLLWPLGEAKRR